MTLWGHSWAGWAFFVRSGTACWARHYREIFLSCLTIKPLIKISMVAVSHFFQFCQIVHANSLPVRQHRTIQTCSSFLCSCNMASFWMLITISACNGAKYHNKRRETDLTLEALGPRIKTRVTSVSLRGLAPERYFSWPENVEERVVFIPLKFLFMNHWNDVGGAGNEKEK